MSTYLALHNTEKSTAATRYELARASEDDLPEVNEVISSSVNSWPLPERLKRVSLPLLHYTPTDLADYDVLILRRSGVAVATAVWDSSSIYSGPDLSSCALLHGLYVHSDHHAQGLGRRLQDAVCQLAIKQGYGGLVVKSQRVSRDYFANQGYEHTTNFSDDYPHLYWKPFTR